MKAKLSENSLFGDSDRDEIRGGGGRCYCKAAPNKSQKYLITDGQRRPEFANFFSNYLEYWFDKLFNVIQQWMVLNLRLVKAVIIK